MVGSKNHRARNQFQNLAMHLDYQVHPGRGPYLALVHGLLSSRAQWLLNLQALSTVCTPVTIELWGHGRSPAPEQAEAYTPQHYVQQFEHIRQTIGIDRWFVCGYSLGAGLTIRYTHTHPEHVIAHIFTNSQSGFAGADTLAAWRQAMPETAAKIRANGKKAIERIAVHPKFAKRLPEPVASQLVADAELLSPVGVAHTMETTNMKASTRDIAAENPRPALMCFGELEKRFHPSMQWAADNMRNLTIAKLQAGHGVNMEDAAGFNQVVTDFIQQHA